MLTREQKLELLDRMEKGVLEQGFARNENTQYCFYRSPTGKKCNIGQIIKDEYYNPEMEDKVPWSPVGGVSSGGELVRSAVESSNPTLSFSEPDWEWLRRVQSVHDMARDLLHYTEMMDRERKYCQLT